MKKLLTFIIFFTGIVWSQHVELTTLESSIEESFRTFNPTGLSVVIVKDGGVHFLKAYGYADKEKGVELTTKHLFNIASLSKAFTTTLMAMMVDEGKVKWESKVIDFLPAFKLSDSYIADNLNVVDIFSHRSGFKTYVGDLLWYKTGYTNEEVIKRMEFLPIDYGFREEYGYQNNMFIIGGEIIEKVTNSSWENNLETRIFNKLGMNYSRSSQDSFTEEDLIATPYSKGEKIQLYTYMAAKPAASIFSNAEDMAKWLLFNLNEGVINSDTLVSLKNLHFLREIHMHRAVSSFAKSNGQDYYGIGLGWFVTDYNGLQHYIHGGSMPGFKSRIGLIPELNAGFFVINNEENGWVNTSVYYQIMDYLTKDKIGNWHEILKVQMDKGDSKSKEFTDKRIAKRIKGTNPSLSIKGFSGLYRDKWYGDAAITVQGKTLSLTFLPTKKDFSGILEHWHYNTFKVDFKDSFFEFGLITFDFNSDGTVEGFTVDLPAYDFHFNNLNFQKIKD